MKEKPVLSICIPTYNRSGQLVKSLESIIRQDGFGDIEVVISDNCSTDDTRQVGERYAGNYPNIKYFRNGENMVDANHSLALARGSGVLRKLSNDTVSYRPGAIACMAALARKYQDSRPLLFFLNGRKLPKAGGMGADLCPDGEYGSLDSFLRRVSYHITWIASLAVWEEDCLDMSVYRQNTSSNLAQVPYFVDLFRKRQGAVVVEDVIMQTHKLQTKNLSYGLYHVFYTNFLGFLKAYVDEGLISEGTYGYVREDLLLSFFAPWVIQFEQNKGRYITSGENLRQLLEQAYGNEGYYGKYRKEIRRGIRKAKFRMLIKNICRRMAEFGQGCVHGFS